MTYYLFRKTTQEYIGFKNTRPFLTTDTSQAHHFANKSKAENYLRHNFFYEYKKMIPLTEMEIHACEDEKRSSTNTTHKITEAEAERYLRQITSLVPQMFEVSKTARMLLVYYSEQVSKADKAQEDLLHKIEFMDEDVVDGYKLYRALRDVRMRRRECKDICTLMNLIINMEYTSPSAKTQALIKDYVSALEKRTYRPRILKNLFKDGLNTGLDCSLNNVMDQIINSMDKELSTMTTRNMSQKTA